LTEKSLWEKSLHVIESKWMMTIYKKKSSQPSQIL